MLKILQNNNLCNVLIVVIRYFGGILLGTGGLVRAYSDSLQKAIEEATIIEKCKGEILKLKISYPEFEKLKYFCEKSKINIIDVNYAENVECKAEIKEGYIKKFLENLKQNNIKIIENEKICKKFITKL